VPVAYLNLVGGQDELVFEGDSMVFDASGRLLYRAAEFAEEQFVVDVPIPAPRSPGSAVVKVRHDPVVDRPARQIPDSAPRLEPEESEIYAALVTGLRDYVRKNGFAEVVIGLSGGIDSALSAAVAADALGPDAVWGVAMPTRFSSEGSLLDARDLAERLGIRFDVIPIDDTFEEFLTSLKPTFAGTDFGVAEENLQARIRGAIVMALSNKFGHMVVTTGNKSEVAVGYATLYGDMAGGYSVLKDVFKTLVYRLAEWRNSEAEVIPRSIIDKPPSAELRPDQKDSDSLPPYDLLDQILIRYVEQDRSVREIIGAGFDPDLVRRVAGLVDRNEYKRRQAAPGVRITRKAFGKDRRLPITNRYREW
jgi:NAD+ synthase (glutamine-hydrolysing)